MISTDEYVSTMQGKTYRELVLERERLLYEVRVFEDGGSGAGAEEAYEMNLRYLGKLFKLISQRYRDEAGRREQGEDLHTSGTAEKEAPVAYEETTAEAKEEKKAGVKPAGTIRIVMKDITTADTEAIVNDAHEGLYESSGVCGAIFRAAGRDKLSDACRAIGGCKPGNAVITPGFNLHAKYIIHAVGPQHWSGGSDGEPKTLYSCYQNALELCRERNIHSVAFPLICAGIYGYPVDKAWKKALEACNDFITKYPDYKLDIYFTLIDSTIYAAGEKAIKEIQR